MTSHHDTAGPPYLASDGSIGDRLGDRRPGPRIYDFASGPDNHHPHATGKIAVGHVGGSAPLTRRQAVIFEFIEPSGHLDLHCPHCVSAVTALAGAPGCVAAAVAVRHSELCPRLARMQREAGRQP